MFKAAQKKRTLEVSIRQASRPDLAQLNEYLLQALERAGERIKFTWPSQETKQEYELIVQAFQGKGEPEWQLALVSGHQQTSGLWSYSTCDVLLIHNLIVSSCNDGGTALCAEGAISVSSSYRQSSRNESSYFVNANAVDTGSPLAEIEKQVVKDFLPTAALPAEVSPAEESAGVTVAKFENLLESAREAAEAQSAPVQIVPKIVDRSMIDAIQQCLRDVHTGFHFYPAFLYELEQEYIRCFRTGAPISVILIRVQFANNPDLKLEQPELANLARTLSALKRGSDLIAYYEHGDLAMLLPDTAANGAHVFGSRIVQGLTQAPYVNAVGESEFKVQIGVGAIPDDCKNLGVLLGVAERNLT